MSNKATRMYKKDKQHTLLPRLRFPQFRDAPTWKQNPIETLARVTQGGTPDTSNAAYWGGPIHWLTPAEMSKGDSPYIDWTNRTLTGDGLHNCSSELLPMHSVIVSTRAPIGHLAINTVPMAINQGCRGLVPVDDALFLYYSLLHAKPRLMDFGAGNTFKELSGSALKRFEVPAPEPAEQQKIADCLGSLDDLIAADGRKLTALRDHKKGLMQQLFPREGETRPRLRLPEFQNAGEWKESTVGSKCQSFSGGTPDTARKDFYGGTIPFIRSAEIGSETTTQFLTEEGYEGSATKMVTRGDVLVALYGANSGDVALARLDGAINQAILCLRPEGSKAFLYHYLTQRKDWILATYLQGGQGNLSGEILKSLFLRFPSPEEQETVADCLASLDALISVQAEKLEALRTHKHGLMQQLFPSPEDGEA